MEHGKFSISKIWHIAKMEYIKLIMDPRMILIVAALVFAYQFITVPLVWCSWLIRRTFPPRWGKTNQCV